jgi:glycosyltransferase involved in cell wall biosynthesis
MSICDTKDMSVGLKRNCLMELATGKYICFIDDDDKISDDYVSSILEAARYDSDVITFNGFYRENNRSGKEFMISKMYGNQDLENIIYRLPNHLCPVRSTIAKQCKFPEKNFGEDSEYAKKINRMVSTEYHIPKHLYYYCYNSNTSQTQNNKNTAYKLNYGL